MSTRGNTIDILRYAEVVAHLRHFPSDKRDEVLARLGIGDHDWKVASEKWKRARDAERLSGKLDLSIQFGRALVSTRERLSMTRPSFESLGPLPGPASRPAPLSLVEEPKQQDPEVLVVAPNPSTDLSSVARRRPRVVTAGISDKAPRAVLPFADPAVAPPPAVRTDHERASPSNVPVTEVEKETVERETVELGAVMTSPATPFKKPVPTTKLSAFPDLTPSEGEPGKLLVRFDPHTGKPLATPIWIDDPTFRREGDKKK